MPEDDYSDLGELTEQDKRDIAMLNAEIGSIDFPIRVPILIPDAFGTPAMEVGIGVFENEDRLTIDFVNNAPGKAVRRIMQKDIVLGLMLIQMKLEEEPPAEESAPSEGDTKDGE